MFDCPRNPNAIERFNAEESRRDYLHLEIDYWSKVLTAAAMALAFCSGIEIARLIPLPF